MEDDNSSCTIAKGSKPYYFSIGPPITIAKVISQVKLIWVHRNYSPSRWKEALVGLSPRRHLRLSRGMTSWIACVNLLPSILSNLSKGFSIDIYFFSSVLRTSGIAGIHGL